MFTVQNPNTVGKGIGTTIGRSLQSVGIPDGWMPYLWNQRFGITNSNVAATQNPDTLQYNYTPQQWTAPQGIAGLATGNMYENPSTPWYIGNNMAQSNPQTSQPNNAGWDSSSFMQGLQSLGYSL